MKIIVGLSGGVDSSVAALLLQQLGYDVEALFMKNWDEDDDYNCNAADDLHDAQLVADKLKIKLHTVNFSSEYWHDVWLDFIDKYKKGLTPNPDILCNQKIKFKVFLDYAKQLGADKIATGHYARILVKNNKYYLQTAIDKNKDQTYFLYLLNQYQLKNTIFPLGGLIKAAVRKIAKQAELITANKKDSTGICFIGKRNFSDFLAKYIKPKQGDIVDEHGNFIKHHNGVYFYTIGQRKGLEIGGGFGDTDKAWFVVAKDISKNQIIVAQGNSKLLYHQTIISNKLYLITDKINYNHKYLAKIRHRAKGEYCKISKFENKIKIIFDKKQKAITPGQAVVFYDNDICIGGAIINDKE